MKPIPIGMALADPKLLGAGLDPLASWSTWIAVLKASFGEQLNRAERRAFASIAGSRTPPRQKVAELWAVAGRRSGKSRIAAAIACYIALCVDHTAKLAAGETGMILVLAASRAQAAVVFGYIKGFIQGSPLLSGQIEGETADELRLKGGITIAVHPNAYRTIRGRTLLACIFDELAFWRDETSATPDLEVYRSVVPALATTGGMLIAISSPYRRAGLLHAKHRDNFDHDSDDVLVVKGPTTTFNPTIDLRAIERARASDPQAARSEWDSEFRNDLSQFLDDATIDAAINFSRPPELPPLPDVAYKTFVDASAGRHDAFSIAIAHRDGEKIIADLVRGRRPPFDPASVAAEYAALAKEYGCRTVTGDNYAPGWVAGAFEAAGCEYRRSPLTRSELYIEGLPFFTRGLVSIPDHQALVRELRLLERRTARSGKDSVDHGVSGSDDLANALFGCLYLCRPQRLNIQGVDIGIASTGRDGFGSNPFAGENGGGFSPDDGGSPTPWLF